MKIMDHEIKKRNPYAFPQTEFNDTAHPDYNGMLLLDYFAAKALPYCLGYDGTEPQEAAKNAYDIAEAMLNEKQKRRYD